MNKVIVYGDINCPFCYALNERLQVHARNIEIEWRAVQHMPNIDSGAPSFQEQAQLTAEVASVRKRAPEVQVITPLSRPNSAAACRLLAAYESAGLPVSALRTLIYRALWREGLDVSRPEVLESLVRQAGLESVQPNAQADQLAAAWQQAWEDGDFDRR